MHKYSSKSFHYKYHPLSAAGILVIAFFICGGIFVAGFLDRSSPLHSLPPFIIETGIAVGIIGFVLATKRIKYVFEPADHSLHLEIAWLWFTTGHYTYPYSDISNLNVVEKKYQTKNRTHFTYTVYMHMSTGKKYVIGVWQNAPHAHEVMNNINNEIQLSNDERARQKR